MLFWYNTCRWLFAWRHGNIQDNVIRRLVPSSTIRLFLSLLTLSLSLFSAATCKPYPHPREDEVFQVCAMHSLMNRSCGILGLPHRVFVHVDFVHADARLTVDVAARLPRSILPPPISYIMWLLEVTPKALCKQGFMGWMWAMYYIVRHLAAYIAFFSKIDYSYV